MTTTPEKFSERRLALSREWSASRYGKTTARVWKAMTALANATIKLEIAKAAQAKAALDDPEGIAAYHAWLAICEEDRLAQESAAKGVAE